MTEPDRLADQVPDVEDDCRESWEPDCPTWWQPSNCIDDICVGTGHCLMNGNAS